MVERVKYVHLTPRHPFPDIGSPEKFRSVVILDGHFEDDFTLRVAEWLVDANCAYVMAWGNGCSEFDDTVDWVNIDRYRDGIPDEKFVMTTWHDDDTLEDVFWQVQSIAAFAYDETPLTKTLIVHLTQLDQETSMLGLFEKSKTLAEREEPAAEPQTIWDRCKNWLRQHFRA